MISKLKCAISRSFPLVLFPPLRFPFALKAHKTASTQTNTIHDENGILIQTRIRIERQRSPPPRTVDPLVVADRVDGLRSKGVSGRMSAGKTVENVPIARSTEVGVDVQSTTTLLSADRIGDCRSGG